MVFLLVNGTCPCSFLSSFPFAYLKLLELCLLRSNETSFPPLVLMMSVLCEAFARFLHSIDLLCEVLEPDMLTVGAPLSREVGDGFLTCSGNFPGTSSLMRDTEQRDRGYSYALR